MLTLQNRNELELRLLTPSRPGHARIWGGALAALFNLGGRVLTNVHAEIRAGRLPGRACFKGRINSDLSAEIDRDYPLQLVGGFEGTDSISGAAWNGRDLFGPENQDGLAKLRFERGTYELPMHAHEHSDRFIVVLRGAGVFHCCDEDLRGFTGEYVESTPVTANDLLVFTRGVVHTFSAPSEALELLSYHRPFLAFDDPRQYTIPAVRWCPQDIRDPAWDCARNA